MTQPTHESLMTLATPYALHAVSLDEERDIERQVAGAPTLVAQAFNDEVRAVRETMAVVSASTAVEPPVALRDRLLAALDDAPPVTHISTARSTRWRRIALAAAAAVIVGLGAVGVGIAIRPDVQQSAADQIISAPDARTVTGAISMGGSATVVFSRERNAAVLVMNDVAPPRQGFVYQMWLVGDDGAHSAGIMDSAAVTPSTTAVLPDLGKSQTLAFTVEPGGGSVQPTTPIFADFSLV